MSVKDCFNKAADSYDQNCQLQIATGERLLGLIEPADSVIDLGCGTGIITANLQYKKLYALDLSDKMLEVAKQKLGERNITYIQSSFDNFIDLELDLAFANMSLQWSEDLKKTLANINANLKSGGTLAFSLPLTGTFSGLGVSTIGFLGCNQIKELLGNWQIIHSFEEQIDYIFPSLIDGLKSIRAVGANYCKSRSRILISREKKPQNLKYNIGYFVVRKH